MKSIFTRPVFINPQAYLVIPELMLINRSTPYDFSSNQYVFQVITTGQIEGKLLQAGNEYILHLDLYSKEGNVVLGEFYLDGSSIGNVDDFTLEQSNGFVTITFGGGNISYPGLIAAWSAKGKSNDDEDREVLKDLTGNGHDISLNGFAFSEMSGYGGYKIKKILFDASKYGQATLSTETKITFSATFPSTSWYYIIGFGQLSTGQSVPKCKVKISGLKEGQNLCFAFHNIILDNSISNGIYELPEFTNEATYTAFYGFGNWGGNKEYENVTIELLPEYPDALVFDGVDDYGINEDMPILTDYTIIVKRKLLGENITWAISKRVNGALLISSTEVIIKKL